MAPTMLPRLVLGAAVAAATLGISGCTREPQYDPRAAELRKQTERSANAEKQVLQLQKDLDAAKSETKKAEQATNDLEAKIRTLEQKNADLKDQLGTLEQKNRTPAAAPAATPAANVEEKTSQSPKNLDAAKILDAARNEAKKAEQARQDAEAKIKTLEQENAALKSQGMMLEQENAALKS